MTEAKPELTEEDRKAVEDVKARLKFFFSDANVRQDFFIRKHLMNEKGDLPHMVTIESLLRFNTIKQYTTKPEVVAAAAKEMSDILTLNANNSAIGRVKQFTKTMMNEHIPKSLHLKDIPLKKKEGEEDSMQYAVTVNDIRDQFEEYGEIAMIKLKWAAKDTEEKDNDKRNKKKYPTGCALIEFETEEALKKAAEATVTAKKNDEAVEPKKKIVFGESQVQVMVLADIVEKKGGAKRKEADSTPEPETDVEVKAFTYDWKPGCVIKLIGVPVDCDREALLEAIATGMGITVDEVKDKKIYVDYSRGNKDAAIRFPETGDYIADVCKKLADGSLEVKGAKVKEAETLDGETEKKYWDEFIAFKNRQLQQREQEKRSRKKQKRQ